MRNNLTLGEVRIKLVVMEIDSCKDSDPDPDPNPATLVAPGGFEN
jgi:hypothetical protein